MQFDFPDLGAAGSLKSVTIAITPELAFRFILQSATIMHLTKKFDRAFQWAGEKMGGESRTAQPEDFKSLEADMALRQQGRCHLD